MTWRYLPPSERARRQDAARDWFVVIAAAYLISTGVIVGFCLWWAAGQ